MPVITDDPARRRALFRLVALAVAVLLLVVGVAAVITVAVRPHGAHRRPDGAAVVPTRSGTAPAVTWRDVAGVRLPFSPAHGPRDTDRGRAAGYRRTREGAALAAVQVLIRASATAGSAAYGPVLGEQVAGVNADALRRRLDEQYRQLLADQGGAVPDGAPIPGNNASVAGYLIDRFDPDAATVEVVLTAPDLGAGRVVAFTLSLEWTDGDWGALARTLDRPPAGLLDYGQVG